MEGYEELPGTVEIIIIMWAGVRRPGQAPRGPRPLGCLPADSARGEHRLLTVTFGSGVPHGPHRNTEAPISRAGVGPRVWAIALPGLSWAYPF